jgi:NADH:ubiquinone oxidoreductase subunit C
MQFNKLNFNIFKKINLKIISVFFKIFKNIKIKIKGFDVNLIIKKKNLINYLTILKKNSSFLFNMLIDLFVEDFPKKKNRYFIKYFIRSINYSKYIQITLKTKEYKAVFSIINLYKSSF